MGDRLSGVKGVTGLSVLSRVTMVTVSGISKVSRVIRVSGIVWFARVFGWTYPAPRPARHSLGFGSLVVHQDELLLLAGFC